MRFKPKYVDEELTKDLILDVKFQRDYDANHNLITDTDAENLILTIPDDNGNPKKYKWDDSEKIFVELPTDFEVKKQEIKNTFFKVLKISVKKSLKYLVLGLMGWCG